NLKLLKWRYVPQKDAAEQHFLFESSSNEDLLLLTEETKGLFMFTRFRPNLQYCKKVINNSCRIWPRGEEDTVNIPMKSSARPGDPVVMPDRITDSII
ncbi:hypothetical protein PFISCL1PPCAC_26087, partial [Pristionchus fissidentatus]